MKKSFIENISMKEVELFARKNLAKDARIEGISVGKLANGNFVVRIKCMLVENGHARSENQTRVLTEFGLSGVEQKGEANAWRKFVYSRLPQEDRKKYAKKIKKSVPKDFFDEFDEENE